jgi:hypothetical protein
MNTTKNFLATLLTLAFLGGLVAGLWAGGAWLVSRVASVNGWPSLDPMLGLALAVLLASFIASRAIHRGQLLDANQQSRDARRVVYESAVMAWQGALYDRRGQGGAIASRLPDDLPALEAGLTMRASATVLRLYGRLRQLGAQSDSSRAQLDGQLLALIIEMRRDLGVAGWRSDAEAIAETIRPPSLTETVPQFASARTSDRKPVAGLASACPAFSLSK